MPDMQRQCTHAWRGRSKRKPKKRYIEQRGERDGGGEESRSIESRLRLSSTCLILSIFRKNRFFSRELGAQSTCSFPYVTWALALSASGMAGYAGMTPEERLAHQKHARTVGPAALKVIFIDALKTEAEGFGNLLAASRGMTPTQVADWRQNPPVTLGQKKADKFMAEVKLRAVRAAATTSVGRPLSEKEWRTLSQSPEWLSWQVSSSVMKKEVAMLLEREIFRILATLPLDSRK